MVSSRLRRHPHGIDYHETGAHLYFCNVQDIRRVMKNDGAGVTVPGLVPETWGSPDSQATGIRGVPLERRKAV